MVHPRSGSMASPPSSRPRRPHIASCPASRRSGSSPIWDESCSPPRLELELAGRVSFEGSPVMLFVTRLFGVTASDAERCLDQEQDLAEEIVGCVLRMQSD